MVYKVISATREQVVQKGTFSIGYGSPSPELKTSATSFLLPFEHVASLSLEAKKSQLLDLFAARFKWDGERKRPVELLLNALMLAVANAQKDSVVKTAALHEAFSLALSDPYSIPDQMPASSALSTHYLSVVFDLINVGIQSVAPRVIRPIGTPTSSTSWVITGHPCRSKPVHLYRVAGALDQLLEDLHNRGDGKKINEDMVRAIDGLLGTTPVLRKFTLKESVQSFFPFLRSIIQSLPQLAPKMGLRSAQDLNVSFFTWDGFESDRNTTTAAVKTQTICLLREFTLRTYRDSLVAIRNSPESPSSAATIEDKLDELIDTLNTLIGRTQQAEEINKLLVCLDIIRFSGVSKKPKHVTDNLKEFFADKESEAVKFFEGHFRKTFVDSLDSFKTDGKGYDFSRLRKFIETHLSDLLAEKYEFKGESRPFTASIFKGKLDKLATSFEEGRTVRTKLEELSSQVAIMDFNCMGGQGRLDAKDRLRDATNDILNQLYPGKVPLDAESRLEFLKKCIERPDTTEIDLDRLKPDVKDTLDHFLRANLHQDVNSKYEPFLILANFEHAEDYLNALFLAVKAGLVKFDGSGNVIEAKIRIMPLFESVADHDAAPVEMERLWSIPFVQRYLKKIGAVDLMKAYSDTSRGDGIMAGVSRLLTATSPVAKLHKRIFGDSVPLIYEHGRGVSPSRSGGVHVDEVWRRSLPKHERENARETIQPSYIHFKAWNPSASAQALYNSIRNNQTASDPKIDEALTPEFCAFMREFTQQGLDAFHVFSESSENSFNKEWFVNSRAAGMITNELPLSPRVKDPQLLAALVKDKTFIDGQRAITVFSLAEQVHFSFHTVVPFYADIQPYLNGKSSKSMEDLQALYRENPVLKIYIQKVAEGLFSSSLETLSLHMDPTSDLFKTFSTQYHACCEFVKAVTQQKELLGDIEDIRSNVDRENYMRTIASFQLLRQFGAYDPRVADERRVPAETENGDWYKAVNDMYLNSRVAIQILAGMGRFTYV